MRKAKAGATGRSPSLASTCQAMQRRRSLISSLPFPSRQECASQSLLTADNANPLTPCQANKVLACLLLNNCLCPAEAARYSWHSLRIGLATTLQNAGCPPHLIQAVSADELKRIEAIEVSIYLRSQSASYAAHFDTTTPVNVAVGSGARAYTAHAL
eukprot:5473823-Pleurochrysis_carterae.AAC.1